MIKIGEHIEFGGIKCICVEDVEGCMDSCELCICNEINGKCRNIFCANYERNDYKNVHFEKVER